MMNFPSWLELIEIWLKHNFNDKYCVIFCRPFHLKTENLFSKSILPESEYAILEAPSLKEAVNLGRKGSSKYIVWDGKSILLS